MEKNAINVNIKLRQRSILKVLKDIDWSTTSKSPYIVEFDPTTKCNLACPDCISGELLNQEKEISIPTIKLSDLDKIETKDNYVLIFKHLIEEPSVEEVK